MVLLLAGCSIGPFDPAASPPRPPGAPELADTSSGLELRFSPSAEAASHAVELVGDDSMILPAEACDGSTCRVVVEGMRGSGDLELEVVAIGSGGDQVPSGAPVSLPPLTIELDEERLARSIDVVRVDAAGRPTVEVVEVADPDEVATTIEELAAEPDVEAVGGSQPVLELSGVAARPGRLAAELPPSLEDQLATPTWHLESLGIGPSPSDAGAALGDGRGVVVAVVDGPVDAQHPGLQGRVVDTLNPTGATPSQLAALDAGHGTGVAGLVAGSSPANGAAPGADLISVVVPQGGMSGELAAGIIAAVDAGADVVNVSMGISCKLATDPTACTAPFESAVAHAEANGVLVVAAVGNNGAQEPDCQGVVGEPMWPGAAAGVVGVGAHHWSNTTWRCTLDVGTVDVLAPGVNLPVYTPGAGTGLESGTSGASPLVAGLAARLLSTDPSLTPADLRRLLTEHLRVGERRIDLEALVEALLGPGAIDVDGATLPAGTYAWGLTVDGAGIWDVAPPPELSPQGDQHGPDSQEVSFQGTFTLEDDGTITGTAMNVPAPGEEPGYGPSWWESESCTGDFAITNDVTVEGSEAGGTLELVVRFGPPRLLGDDPSCISDGMTRASIEHARQIVDEVADNLPELRIEVDAASVTGTDAAVGVPYRFTYADSESSLSW